jgi:uncharacterized protein YndB with AHSA1/START domain
MNNSKNQRDLVVSRVFNAPVAMVWKIWTEAELIMRWWGPDHFTCPTARIDFREGGTSVVCMRAPKEYGGQDMFSTWAYTRIVPLQSIEFVQEMADKHGNPVDPVSLGLPPEFPKSTRTLVTFKDLRNGTTEMTVTQYGMPPADTALGKNAELGWNQSIDKMLPILSTR